MPEATPYRVLLVSGSLRANSINTAVLRTARVVAQPGIAAVLYERLSDLPHFNPDDDVELLHPAVAELRAAVRGSDAVLFSTPEYAGALPGSFKNLLDWIIGDDKAGSIYEKPVAWINASAHGAVNAVDSLRTVLGYAHAAIIDAACVDIPITRAAIGDDGLIADASTRDTIKGALATLERSRAGEGERPATSS